MKRFAITAAAALLSACSHQPQARVSVPRHPSAVEINMSRQVRNALDAGDGDLAANRLRERMAKDPSNTALRMELASLYRQRGNPDLALEHYRLILEREPGHGKAVLALVETMRDGGQAAQAALLLEKFLEEHPARTSELPAWLGMLFDDAGQARKAESAHRLALSHDENNAKLHNNLGYNLLTQERREDAIAEFNRALAIDAKLVIARNNLALALARSSLAQDRQEALLHWQALNGPASAHNNLGVILMEQGAYPEARHELKTALEHNRNFVPAMRNLAILAAMDGKPAVVAAAAAPRPAREARGPMRRIWNGLIGAGSDAPAQPGAVARVKPEKGERTAQ